MLTAGAQVVLLLSVLVRFQTSPVSFRASVSSLGKWEQDSDGQEMGPAHRVCVRHVFTLMPRSPSCLRVRLGDQSCPHVGERPGV